MLSSLVLGKGKTMTQQGLYLIVEGEGVGREEVLGAERGVDLGVEDWIGVVLEVGEWTEVGVEGLIEVVSGGEEWK